MVSTDGPTMWIDEFVTVRFHFSLCCWRFISEKPLKPGEVGKVSTKQLPLYLIYPSNIIHTIFITNR